MVTEVMEIIRYLERGHLKKFIFLIEFFGVTPYNPTKHCPQRKDVSDTKLIKIDTTPDLSQKAKKQ